MLPPSVDHVAVGLRQELERVRAILADDGDTNQPVESSGTAPSVTSASGWMAQVWLLNDKQKESITRLLHTIAAACFVAIPPVLHQDIHITWYIATRAVSLGVGGVAMLWLGLRFVKEGDQ